jgi:hypothetical protein
MKKIDSVVKRLQEDILKEKKSMIEQYPDQMICDYHNVIRIINEEFRENYSTNITDKDKLPLRY